LYIPAHFREDRTEVLHQAIRQTGLATLVTLGADGLEASHVPLLLDPESGPQGALRGHIARANPQWRRASANMPALAIFLGPGAYISPSAYATKRATGRVVPTWNYVAVHAYGTIEFFDDAERLRAIVTDLTERHEIGREPPWMVSDAPADYIAGMLRGIVGFRLAITRLEGKRKLSQNRSADDQAGVVRMLGSGGENEQAIAHLMRSAVDPPETSS